jgi:acetyl esterase/lipase
MRNITFLLAIMISVTTQAVTLDALLDAKPTRVVSFPIAGGQSLTMGIFDPNDLRANEKRTALVWIHGGGWTAGDATSFYPHAQYSADRGAIGISINYRLFGKGARNAADCLDDCRSAIVYLRDHAAELQIDPNRIAVLGDSSGGHLAAALGTIADPINGKRSRPDAMVLFNPITDCTQGTWWYAASGTAPKKGGGTQPSADVLAEARSLSPIWNISAGDPPTLVMHGLNDHVVIPGQSQRFTDAMRAAGNSCELILVPGSRHAFVCTRYTAPPATVVGAISEADRFLAKLHFLDGLPTLTTGDTAAH